MKKEITLEKLQEKYRAIQEEEEKRKALAESQEYYQRILEEMAGTDYSQCLKAANNFYDDIGKIEKNYNKRSKR